MTVTPARRRLVTLITAFTVLVVLLILGFFVKVPYVALGPGPTVNTLGTINTDDGPKDIVEISGIEQQKLTGNLNLTTVSVHDELTLFESLGMWVSGNYSIAPRELYYPPDQSTDEVRQQQVDQMSGSEESATAAALNHLKVPVALKVGQITTNSPASGKLKPNDVILAMDGKTVTTYADFRSAVSGHKPGDEVTLDVRTGTEQHSVAVKLGSRADDAKAAFLGVGATLVPADPKITINYHVGNIGGPSAGLMLTLAVIDKFTTGNITHGKFIAGTGTMDPDGKVGEIGGIPHKIKAARDAGAEYFFVPAGNCAEAKSDAPDGIELIKVSSLDDALGALEQIGSGAARTHC